MGELGDRRQDKRGDSGGGVEDVGVRDPKDSDAEAPEGFVTARILLGLRCVDEAAATKPAMGCCRRNRQPKNERPLKQLQSAASASVGCARSSRARRTL